MRELRPLVPNGIYHVTVRGVRQTPLFRGDRDWVRYLDFLADCVERFDWRCHSYCLMPNHVHLLVQTPQANLPQGMQRLNLRYAIRFNARYGYKGHAFERRYWSRLVTRDSYLVGLARYIARNPVRAGLVEHPSEWRWSSYAALARLVDDPAIMDPRESKLLFGSPAQLRDFVEAPDKLRLKPPRPGLP